MVDRRDDEWMRMRTERNTDNGYYEGEIVFNILQVFLQ